LHYGKLSGSEQGKSNILKVKRERILNGIADKRQSKVCHNQYSRRKDAIHKKMFAEKKSCVRMQVRTQCKDCAVRRSTCVEFFCVKIREDSADEKT